MDYKYIEQLLERYWKGETSLEEEQILRSFFRQKELPAHLRHYKALFCFLEDEQAKGMDNDFETRILFEVERPVVKAARLTMRARFMPLFKAACLIGILFATGTVMQRTMDNEGDVIIAAEQTEDAGNEPQMAVYDPVLPIDTVIKVAVDETGTGKTEVE